MKKFRLGLIGLLASLAACVTPVSQPLADIVLRGGEHSGATPGRFVRGPGWKRCN